VEIGVVKEPLLWFVLIGGILFTADHFSAPDAIIVDDAVRNQIATLWETQMGKGPSAKELDSLVHDWVRQEVFYREAMRLGLDRDDTIVRRRLVQKLGFLAREVNEESITSQDVQTYYEAQIADYTLPVRYTLSQIYFSSADQHETLMQQLAEGSNWMELGESSLLPRSLIRKSERQITSTLGTQFTAQLNKLIEGQWVGPIKSTFGHHLVKLEALSPEEATPLAYIEKRVVEDLLHQRREQSLEDYYQELTGQYEVDYQ
jgi:peptidyl-prolyl cis-trans isomerase C